MPSLQRSDAPLGRTALDASRLDELMSLGHGAPLPLVKRSPLPELVVRLARAEPARTAVSSGGSVITYGMLEAWSGRIAARLVAAGVGRGSRVGLLIAPSTAMVAAALGILRAGAAYVPVAYAQPDRRIAEVLADARVTCVVVTSGGAGRLAGLGPSLIGVDADAMADGDGPAEPAPSGPALPVATAEDAAYLIYTSGSTGEPKGVLVEHGQLAASTAARHRVYPGAPVFLLVSPLSFDSSVAGLWGTLAAGGSLVAATQDEIRDPERLVELVHRHKVTRLLCVPSLYSVILDAAERSGIQALGTLDTVIVAGETLPETLVRRHFAVHPRAVALVNEYGPTEATVWASYRRFEAPGPVSIGGPIPGVQLYVLDDRMQPVPRGAAGELVIGGAGVSRGYFGRPDATARAFIPDPFAGTEGARMYRTGDLVRWDRDGTLHLLGRRDQQVKIRGHRVELGAIEAALCSLPGIRDAAVVSNRAQTALAGFVIASCATTSESVRKALAERLPTAMIPARIRILDKLPLTVSGKVDRDLLRAGADEPSAVPQSDTAPDTAGTAAQVAAAWAEVLKVSDVPADANFFDLGGNSLTMFQVRDALERHTGTRLSVVALFRHTTVSAQAALIRDGATRPAGSLPETGDPAARRVKAALARRQRKTQETSS
jgi:amino acid adenylation domain-containing protein